MKRTARVPSQLSESLHRRLNAYALAASAAGVGMLALTQPAEARVVYTKIHQRIPTNTFYPLDIDHDGTTNLSIYDRSTTTGSGVRYDVLYAFLKGSIFVEGLTGGGAARPFALRLGAPVESPWNTGVTEVMAAASSRGKETGNWVNVNNHYLGLRFQIKGRTHYGWVRLSVEVKGPNISATLTGYAYETIPNKRILAGQEHGRDEATLGRLAQGASGVSNGGKP
jgi:hypothetical protein